MAKVIEVKPHYEEPEIRPGAVTVFLAGTIDMGNSEDWQHKLVEEVKTWDLYGHDYVFYNPRRDEGFSDDKGEFEYQVNWELDHLESCKNIIMCILGTSKSPITLMELGLFARSGKLEVICEPNFYRYGNVKITCERYGVPLYSSLEEYLKLAK